MNLTYVFYLILILPLIIFSLWVSKEKVLKDEPAYLEYATSSLIILGLWGELAIYFQQWYYPRGVNLNIYIGNQPLETYILGIIAPLFVISVWEFVKRRR